MRPTALYAFLLVLAACGLPPQSGEPPPPDATSTPPATTAPGDGEGVRVVVTATPVRRGDGAVELCPPGMSGRCPGIFVTDDIVWRRTDPVIRIAGRYDGAVLVPTSSPQPVHPSLLETPDFSSLCPELRGTGRVNPSNDLTEALGAYVAGRPDYAGMWWDAQSAVMTVWFVGDDVSGHRAAIAELAGGEPVCVAGGARYSEAELLEAMDLIGSITDSRGRPLTTPGYGIDTVANTIPLFVQELDTETRQRIEDTLGERVTVSPYLEMTEGSLADLPEPVPVVAGDVAILTNPLRFGGGMTALGRFTVRYDPELNCIYLDEGGERVAAVWPFGYSATSDPPATVYDYDGKVVARDGDIIELGGGGTEPGSGEEACAASSLWMVNA